MAEPSTSEVSTIDEGSPSMNGVLPKQDESEWSHRSQKIQTPELNSAVPTCPVDGKVVAGCSRNLDMDGEGCRPPQTMGEPSSNGPLESVVDEPRSVNTAASASETCDGQTSSRVIGAEASLPVPVENGTSSHVDNSVSSSPGGVASAGHPTPASASEEALALFGLKNVSRTKVAEILGGKTSARTQELGTAYMALFDFSDVSVVDALRILLERCSIVGETQAQERIVQFFSKRYAECNSTVGDADAVHSLTAAIMLLNQDLHGQNLGKKMTTSQFLSNVALLRDGKTPIPKAAAKDTYAQIKSRPLRFVRESEDSPAEKRGSGQAVGTVVLPNSVVEVDLDDFPTVLREGLLKRKNVGGGFGHRHWSVRYCVVRGFIMHLFKTDSKSTKSVPNFAELQNAVILTHALATPAVRYHKRQHCLQLVDSNGIYHLFQASNYDDLTSWVVAINRAAAIHCSRPLAAPCGSSTDRFERPPLPKHPSKAAPEDQLAYYRKKVDELILNLAEEQEYKPANNTKNKRAIKTWEARYGYMSDELVRYQSYVEAMTLNHEFAPTAKFAAELISPSQSISSMSSSTSVVSVRSQRSRMHWVSPQTSSLASTAERSQSVSDFESLTPPPGSASGTDVGLGRTRTRDSYREAVTNR